jgi:hypothetical protein
MRTRVGSTGALIGTVRGGALPSWRMNPDKPVHANNVPTPTPTDSTRGQVTRDQIARRAEQVWRDRRQPTGQDDAIWLEAEAQLKAEAESKPVTGTESRPLQNETTVPLKSRTKVQDPADAAVQLQSGQKNQKTPPPGPRLRNQ